MWVFFNTWLRVVCFKSYHFTGEKIATDLWPTGPTSTLSPDLWIKNWIPTMHYLPKQVAFSCTQNPEKSASIKPKEASNQTLVGGVEFEPL